MEYNNTFKNEDGTEVEIKIKTKSSKPEERFFLNFGYVKKK